MESEKVKEIKETLRRCGSGNFGCCWGCSLQDNHNVARCTTILCEKALILINELESENDTLHTNLCEYRRENKELSTIVSIANEREYRKKFNDEWRKEYQKELDKQGNGHIAGYPDFDLVYKLYFEQKDRIAELEKEIEENAFYSKGYAQGIKNTYEGVVPDKLKQFAERLKENFRKNNIESGIWLTNISIVDETLKQFVE